MFENVKGKKLLVVGGAVIDLNIVNVAREMGAYVITVDRNTDYSKSPAKLASDEAWDIDCSDLEAVAEKRRLEHVDGIMAGYSEFRVLAASKISEMIGKPFYATSEQIEMTRSKRSFKDLCIRFGVPIAKDWCFGVPPTEEEKDRIEYPVIVKPTDYAGCKGITVCYNREQLEEAIQYALSLSQSKTIIIEDYLIGTELMAIYTIVDGKATLSMLNEKYISQDHKRISGLCDVVLTPSKYHDMYVETIDEKMKGFLNGIGAKNGVAFFQFIANQNGIRAFEMGYRINGNTDCMEIEKYNNINYLKMCISYSLTGSMGDDNLKDNPLFGKYLCSLLTYVHGGTVGTVSLGNLVNGDGIDDIFEYISVGKTVPENDTTEQKAVTVKISAPTLKEIAEKINHIYAEIQVNDVDGNNMLFKPFNTARLFES